MTDAELCRTLLSVVAAVPSPVKWHVIALPEAELLLLADDRDQATALVLESTASQVGDVLATESLATAASSWPLLGCLVRPAVAVDEAAEALRTAYEKVAPTAET